MTTKRKRATYGTKRYGYKAALHAMREYAQTERTTAMNKGSASVHTAHGKALGAVSALFATGAINQQQYDRMFTRMHRIIHAKVTRLPRELRRVA